MGITNEITVYHGTDYDIAELIVSGGFKYNKNDEHWLGNGIYFYSDLSLAKWWTKKPSNKFGADIKKPAIIKCILSIDEDNIMDLSKLEDYLIFSQIYKDEFLPKVYDGDIIIPKYKGTGRFDSKKLRCSYCDTIKDQYDLKALVGTFNIPHQPYLPKEYGEGFKYFSINYIETQICVFDADVIIDKQIIAI